MKSPQTEDGFTQIANELLEAFSRLDASGSAWRVFMVVLRKTYGFHKKKDKISLTQFEDMSRLTRMSVCRGLNELVELNVITVEKDGYINIYQVQKDYELWGSIIPVTSNKYDTKSSIKPVTKTSNKYDTYKRKKDNKEISKQSLPIKGNNNNDMGNWNKSSDNDSELPSINDDGEVEKDDIALRNEYTKKVTANLKVLGELRGKPFADMSVQRRYYNQCVDMGFTHKEIALKFNDILLSEFWIKEIKEKKHLPDMKTVYGNLKNVQ